VAGACVEIAVSDKPSRAETKQRARVADHHSSSDRRNCCGQRELRLEDIPHPGAEIQSWLHDVGERPSRRRTGQCRVTRTVWEATAGSWARFVVIAGVAGY